LEINQGYTTMHGQPIVKIRNLYLSDLGKNDWANFHHFIQNVNTYSSN